MRLLRRLAWFVALALAVAALSLLVGWFFCLEMDAATPDIEATVRYWARYYDVDPDYMWCLCLRESNGEQTAVGKAGELGILQWMPDSWEHVRRIMGEPEWSWLRLDIETSAETTAFALGELGLYSWWSTHDSCKHLDKNNEPW